MPQALLTNLETVRKRVRVLAIVHGVGLVIAVLAGLLFVTVSLDYFLNLPALPRVVVILAALAALGYAAFRWIIKPGLAELSLSDVAGRLERAFPQFDDRLRSTVNFLRTDVPGSDIMKQRVVEQATSLASNVDLTSAIVAKPAWYAAGGGMAAVGVLILLAALAGEQFRSIALKHLLMPFADRPWPHRVQIEADGTLPARVPVGQRIDVKMKLARGDSSSMKAVVCYQYDNGPIEQEFMTRADGGGFAASLDARVDPTKAAGALKVWIKAGDDRLDLPVVNVVPRLAVKSVEAIVTPPKYVANAVPTTVNLSAAPAMMAVGSDVALRVTFNKPLAADSQPTLVPVDSAPTDSHRATTQPSINWTRDGDPTAVGHFTAASSMQFHVKATDLDGFNNLALEEYEVLVRPDQTPSVQIEEPRRNEERTAVSTVPLQALAEDDYGIQTLTLIVNRLERGETTAKPPTTMPSHWEIPLVINGKADQSLSWTPVEGTGDRLRFRANYSWDLSQLKDASLHGGDLLEYFLLVTDNYNLNGQTHPPVPSGKLRISIISQEDLTNRIIAELQNAKNQIGEVKSVQSRTQQETSTLADDSKKKPDFDNADRTAAERLTNQQSGAASQTKAIAGKIEELGKRLEENKSPAQDLKDLTHDVATDLNDTAEKPMKQATQDLTEAQNAKPADARNEKLDDAKGQQNQANDNLQRALDRMGDIGSLQQTIARINDLLKEQKDVGAQTQDAGKNALGQKPEEMKPEDRKKLDAAADNQSKLADKTAKALDQMKKQGDQLSKSDPAAAEAMSKAAETAKQQQVTSNQQKAAQQAKQNQQASAQSAQKQVELGLQMILNDLQQAERRKLAQLSKQLEEMQQQIANLIRRQAEHNLDNLTVQGPAVIAKVDVKLIADLNDQAQRDPKQPQVAPDPTRLAPSQEQTERNTRDLSKTAEALPNGAEPASQLLRAADHMERAIVNLRDSKLPDAYDPPQVGALAALTNAKKLIDEQKAKVDQQLNDADKEAVRQKYVKIKEDQQKLDTETTRIETARDPQGALGRADAIRLGQLPGEQGKLADRVNELEKDLAAVDSIIYQWANKDIATSMNDVKGELGKSVTDSSTQAEQARVVEQLDAMIRNLATKPKESKFATEGGGGGGGGGGGPTPLPPEAELRMLKDLQKAVNTNTKALDAKKEKDKAGILALGTRQGEFRNLLNELLTKASQGKLKLGPEPDAKNRLPEEAKQEDVENDELLQGLLNDKPSAEKEEKSANLIGDRMARSRQRLAIDSDTGKVTQVIQDRILDDLDLLIDQARQQTAEMRNPPKGGQGQQQSKPGDQMAKADNQGKQQGPRQPKSSNPAQQSNANAPGNANTDLSKQIKESLEEWGQITPRLRQAQIE